MLSGLVNSCIGCFSDSSAISSSRTVLPDALARASICCCTSGVSTQPGQMALQVMPVGGLDRHHLGQADKAVLGRDIGGLLAAGDQAVRRGDVDDAAPFALLHAGHRGADGVERRREVDRDDRVPFLDREILDIGDMLDAGIVHQDVDRAEALFRRLDHAAISAGLLMSAGE